MTRSYSPDRVVATEITTSGCNVVGVEVFSSGHKSILRQHMGTYDTPEHALIIKEILSNPVYLVHLSANRFPKEKIDAMAAELKTRRIPGSNTMTPAGIEVWAYAPYVYKENPSET